MPSFTLQYTAFYKPKDRILETIKINVKQKGGTKAETLVPPISDMPHSAD